MSFEKSLSSIPNESNEVKVTVTLVLNASFSWVEKPTKNFITYHSIVLIILPCVALIAICLNIGLLLAIVCSSSLKRVILNQYMSVVSVACLMDCCLNVPFSFHYLKTHSLVSVKTCTVNAAFVLFISLLTTWGICGMCIERCMSIFERNKHRLLRFCKHPNCIVFQILLAVVIVLPLELNEVRKFSDRISCSIALKKHEFYRIVILMFFFVPVSIGLMAIFSSLLKNFRKIRNIGMQNMELSYAELFFEESHLWHEWQSTKFVGCIVLLFLILELPFIIRLTETVPTHANEHEHVPESNSTTNLPVTQPASPTDRVIFWCRIAFCVVFPIAAILLRKDIMRKITSMLSLCKSNSTITIKSANESETVLQECKPDEFLVPQVWRRRRLSSVTCLSPPIVFGRARESNTQFQLLDLSAGIAKWKALYLQSKTTQQHSQAISFFDDEDEVVEFERYEDGTEEELDSSEMSRNKAVKEVAVQTTSNCFQTTHPDLQCPSGSNGSKSSSIISAQCTTGRRGRRNRNRRLSKSFSLNRQNYLVTNYRNYVTYPKHTSRSNQQHNLQTFMTTPELLKALQAYRLRKYSTVINNVPRSTGELMDCTSEGTDIVSL